MKTITVEGAPDWECYAEATCKETGEVLKGPTVSVLMAIKEGWYDKDGSKWQTMPELMIQYRAAAFFGRLYASDLLAGLHHADEVEDISRRDQSQPTKVKSRLDDLVAPEEVPEVVDAEVVEPEQTELGFDPNEDVPEDL